MSFVIAGNHTITGLIDAQHHVVDVQTSMAQSIVGDMLVEIQRVHGFGGVQFPSHIVQQ